MNAGQVAGTAKRISVYCILIMDKKEAFNMTKRNVERYFYAFHGY